MGDPRRFREFARLIAHHVPARDAHVVDVAGGRGGLRAALGAEGFRRVTTYDPRQYDGRDKPRPARVRNCAPGHTHFLKLFDYRQVPGHYGLVVAMHPDEGTDHAILYAARHNVPALVCPCCIKPSAVEYRGERTKAQWCQHLARLAPGMRHQWFRLDIEGDARVLVILPRR